MAPGLIGNAYNCLFVVNRSSLTGVVVVLSDISDLGTTIPAGTVLSFTQRLTVIQHG